MASVGWADSLPNPATTPGKTRTDLTVEQICTTKWGHDRRHVTARMKEDVFAAYGIPKEARHDANHKDLYEVDHLISREIGGADAEENLWPESYVGDCNAHDKDRVENALHREVCANPSEDALHAAQQAIATNWIAEYEKRYGSCKHQ
jgi:hypothetical protein